MKKLTSILAALLILRSVVLLVFANNAEKKESSAADPLNDVMEGYSESSRAYIDLSDYPMQISDEDGDGGAYYIVEDDDYYYIAYMYINEAEMIEPDETGYYRLVGVPVEADMNLIDFVIEYMNEPYWNSDGEWVEVTEDEMFTEDDYFTLFGTHYLDTSAAIGSKRTTAYVLFILFAGLGILILIIKVIVAIIRRLTGRRRSEFDNVPDGYSQSGRSYSGADYEPILRDSDDDYTWKSRDK